MRERPILFSGPMVRAILEGRKSMTRRVVKGPVWTDPSANPAAPHVYGDFATPARCPYGEPGDRLWVRETHYAFGRWVVDGTTKTGRTKWRFEAAAAVDPRFDAPAVFRVSRSSEHPGRGQWYKRLARFMPRKYSRIALEVTGVRVERLVDISEADARAEGVTWPRYDDFEPMTIDGVTSGPARIAFKELWSNINGAASWYRNPLVWVVSFRVIATT